MQGSGFAGQLQKTGMKRILLFFACAVFMMSCASTKNEKSADLDGSWELSAFPGATKTFDEMFSQRKPQLQFNSAKATVAGTTGCNRLAGTYSASADNFSFGSNIVTTKMACSGYDENVFLQALNKINHFELKGDQLQLMHDNELIMLFTKKPL